MVNGSGCKPEWPCCLEAESSTAANDKGGRAKHIQMNEKSHTFAFMDLPSEIRNIIYQKTLTRPGGVFFIGNEYSNELCRSRAILGNKPLTFEHLIDNTDEHAVSTRNLALLRTSKAIHAEAGAIIYGQKLVFPNLMSLQSFLVGLRHSKLSLLRHVVIANDRWPYRTDAPDFMPAVFALLACADSLETLEPDNRYMELAFVRLRNAMIPYDTISVTGWDAAVARALASEVYCRLFTYLRRAVAVRGIDKVMEVVNVFGRVFQDGPDYMCLQDEPKHVFGVEWTEERKAAMKKAMGEEIERLLEKDSN